MKNLRLHGLVYALLTALFVISLTTSVFAQGRGRGGGVGGGSGAGRAGVPPPGAGVDRGLGNASSRSNGRSDDGLGNASTRSNGRSDAGLERARIARDNLNRADRDLREHPGIANTLRTNANDLRAGYQAALVNNPNLKFGQYVAATRLAQNLGGRFPAITRAAILDSLAEGNSIGRTLQDLGLSSNEASEAKKRAEREIKRARN
ncbi:MAG: hypothetical protein ABR557_05445 [Pyrinomonadaceae bacterium]